MCEMYSFLRLKDPALQEAYQAFNEDNLNLSSLLTPAILTISIIIPLYITYGSNLNRLNDSTFDLISCIIIFTTMNGLLLDVVRVYLQQRKVMRQHDGHLPLASKRFLKHFQQRFFLVIEIILCFRHLARIIVGCQRHPGSATLPIRAPTNMDAP
eukprot:gene10079-11155_t